MSSLDGSHLTLCRWTGVRLRSHSDSRARFHAETLFDSANCDVILAAVMIRVIHSNADSLSEDLKQEKGVYENW